MTILYEKPIRLNMPVVIGIYTFVDANTGNVIDLTADFVATSVMCELKRKGDAYSPGTLLTGALVAAALGTVKVASHSFTAAGVWVYQFYCLNAAGEKLWGDRVRFIVGGNTEDLGADELPD